MKMKKIPYKCPVCGGHIVKEYYGDYGEIHRINKDGSTSKRSKVQIYETHGEDDRIIYCEDCGKILEENR